MRMATWLLSGTAVYDTATSCPMKFDRSTKTGVIVLSSSSGGNAEYKPLVRKILSMLNPASRGGSGEPLQETHEAPGALASKLSGPPAEQLRLI